MRRKRRNQGVWLPTIGAAAGGDTVLAGRFFTLTGTATPTIHTVIFPILRDFPQNDDVAVTSTEGIGEIVENDYIVKRIVGKAFISRRPIYEGGDTNIDIGVPLVVTAGFFVARAGDPGTAGAADAPIGAVGALADSSFVRDNYSPLDADTIREPWMWRRTWVLGNAGAASADVTLEAGTEGLGSFPASTALYGSVMDGPHFDVKSKRRVGLDERLWFAVSMYVYTSGGATGTNLAGEQINGYLDYRAFGQVVKAQGKGVF